MIKFARSILANLATLILSFILAVIIWFNALRGDDPTRTLFFQIPLELIGRPDSAILISPSNTSQTVQIAFQGPASIVTNLTDQNFSATLDLSQVPFGVDTQVPINVQANNTEITLISQSPESLTVHLEQTITRDIPVELDLRGSVAIGYSQGEALIDPEFITVSGVASQVEDLDVARVTVFLTNDRETVRRTPQPIFYNRQGRVASVNNMELSTEQVEVTIPINESAGFAEKTINVDLQGEPAPGYRIVGVEVDPPTVLVQGRPTQLDLLSWVTTEPIDVNGLTESFQPQVALSLPDGVTLAEVDEITVNITIEPFRTTSIFNRVPQVQGLGEGLTAVPESETVRVVLFGPLPVLNALLEDEVSVVIDLFGLPPGTYSVEPDVNYPEQRGIELRSIQPAQVTVQITQSLTTTHSLTETLPLTPTTSLHVPASPSTVTMAMGEGWGATAVPVIPLADTPKQRYYWRSTF